jgi:hypothetical protein
MLSVGMLIEFVKDLEGFIPEECRGVVARRLTQLITSKLQEIDSDTYKHWVYMDRLRFIQQCRIADPGAPYTLKIPSTKLAEFYTRWMTAYKFQLRNNPSKDWRTITPEQNALRVTILDELRSLDNPEK